MKVNESLCKVRWNNIRDNYRKSLRKFATKSGKTAKRTKAYKYSDQLSFMNKFFDERETKERNEFIEEEPWNEGDDERQDDIQNNVQDNTNEYSQSQLITNKTEAMTRSDRSSIVDNDVLLTSSRKLKVKRNRSQTTTSPEPIQFITNKNANQDPSSISTHPVDAFAFYIALTLKSLDPHYSHSAKTEIFEIVQKYEMKMLKQQSNPNISNQFEVLQQMKYESSDYSITSSPTFTPMDSLVKQEDESRQ